MLGASRFRLLRQFLTESLLLCGLGGTSGVLVAAWVLNLLTAILPENFPRIVEIKIDPWVLGFTAATALLAGLVLGTAPAFQRGETDLSRSLKGASGFFGSAGHGFRNLLAVAEVALALVLSVGAGLLVKSYWLVTHIDLGFSPENVLAVGVWTSASNEAQRDAFYSELFERVRRLPRKRRSRHHENRHQPLQARERTVAIQRVPEDGPQVKRDGDEDEPGQRGGGAADHHVEVLPGVGAAHAAVKAP